MSQCGACQTPTKATIATSDFLSVGRRLFNGFHEDKYVNLYLATWLWGFFAIAVPGLVVFLAGQGFAVFLAAGAWLVMGFLVVVVGGIVSAGIDWYNGLEKRLDRWVTYDRMNKRAAMLLYYHHKMGHGPVPTRKITPQMAALVDRDYSGHGQIQLHGDVNEIWMYVSDLDETLEKGIRAGLYMVSYEGIHQRYELTERGIRMGKACWNEADDAEKQAIEKIAWVTKGMNEHEFIAYFGGMLKNIQFGFIARETFEEVRVGAAASMVRSGRITPQEGAIISGFQPGDFDSNGRADDSGGAGQ